MRRGGIQAVPHFHCHRRYGMCTIARGSRAAVRSVPAPGTGFVFFAFAGGIYAAPTNARYRFCHPNRCTPGLARFWGRDRVCLMRRGGIQAVPHFHCHRRYGMCTIARGSRAAVRSVPAPGTGFVFFAFAGGIYAAPTNARYRFCHPNRCTPGAGHPLPSKTHCRGLFSIYRAISSWSCWPRMTCS